MAREYVAIEVATPAGQNNHSVASHFYSDMQSVYIHKYIKCRHWLVKTIATYIYIYSFLAELFGVRKLSSQSALPEHHSQNKNKVSYQSRNLLHGLAKEEL